MKKIVLAAPTSIPARRANTVQVMKMAQALTILGHQVDVLSPEYLGSPSHGPDTTLQPRTSTHDPYPEWERMAEHYGLQHRFPIHWLPANRQLRGYDYSLKAYRWAQRSGCDIYYTRLIQSAAISSITGMKTILEVHDLPSGKLGPAIFRLFLRGRGALRMAVITQALARDLAQQMGAPGPGMPRPGMAGSDRPGNGTPGSGKPGRGSFTIISPDGVDLVRFNNLPKPEDARHQLVDISIRPERFTAGYTGHLYQGRGIDMIKNMAKSLPHIQFLLVGGESSDVQRLREKIHQEGLTNLILAGFVPNKDLPLYQAACDVLLMPYGQNVSASSGGDIARYLSPMKLFEYMACERPIMSSDLPPLLEILNEHNAVLLPGSDVGLWAESLENLRQDPTRAHQLALQARQDVNKYTWEVRAENLLAGL